jgi:hypothetical protein
MTIQSFDKETVKQLRAELQNALNAVAQKHGLVVGLGTIRFGASEFGVRLKVSTKSNSSQVNATTNTVEFEDLKRHGMHRCPGLDITKTYSFAKLGDIKFVGFHERRYKFPFTVQTSNGKRYKISVFQAANILHTAK